MEGAAVYFCQTEKVLMRDIFYNILNAGLWEDRNLSKDFSFSENEIDTLFEMGRLQAVGGLMMTGMNVYGISLGKQKVRWINTLMGIENKNRKIDVLAEKIVSSLNAEGMNAEVFKGVSVAKWYRNPLARSYGDIDVVITEGFENIVNILGRKKIPFTVEHQDIVCNIEGISVEFHPQREYVYCTKDNRTLQRLVKDFPNSNEVYLACIIVHLRRHMLTYGVGMKQVCDVAVMLKNADMDMDFMAEIIRELHMERFCAALFGFLKRCLEVEVFPIGPDCGRNSLFIEETVWRDGYILKMQRENRSKGLPALRRVAGNAWFWVKRCVRMSAVMPREAACFIPYMVKRRIS